MDEKAAKIEAMAKEIEAENRKRWARAKRTPSRPLSYRYAGLEEHTTVMMPEGVAAGECDTMGKDVSRILHREPAKVWVEIIKRPLLRAPCLLIASNFIRYAKAFSLGKISSL